MRTIRRALLLAVAALAISLATAPSLRAQELPENGIHVAAPDIPPGQKWLNTQPLALNNLRGKVVLIDFWEYTCVNCIRTLPYIKAWNEKYKDKGLVIIGVHTPEFQFAKQEANVAKSVKQFGLTYPILVDSNYDMWRAYSNQFWPAKYLIDAQGFVRYLHFGEGSYERTEGWIQKLLKEANPKVDLPELTGAIRGTDKPGAVCYPMTPELYVGSERGVRQDSFGSREGYRNGKVVSYREQGLWEDGRVYAYGEWFNTPEALISTRDAETPHDYIGIKYHALEVNSVIRPEKGKPVTVWILHDGKPVAKADKGDDIKYDDEGRSFILVDQPRMYSLIKNAKYAQRSLKLLPAEPGLGVYSFTFVSCEVAHKQ